MKAIQKMDQAIERLERAIFRGDLATLERLYLEDWKTPTLAERIRDGLDDLIAELKQEAAERAERRTR